MATRILSDVTTCMRFAMQRRLQVPDVTGEAKDECGREGEGGRGRKGGREGGRWEGA